MSRSGGSVVITFDTLADTDIKRCLKKSQRPYVVRESVPDPCAASYFKNTDMGERSSRLKAQVRLHHLETAIVGREKEIHKLRQENERLREEVSLLDRKPDGSKQQMIDFIDWERQEIRRLEKELYLEKKRCAEIINTGIWGKHILEYKDKVNQISASLHRLQDYHLHYDKLVASLNCILRVKHNVAILKNEQIDSSLIEALKLVKLIRRFTKSKSEIFDLVRDINEEYRSINTISSAIEWHRREFFPDKQQPVSFFDVFNKLLEINNDLRERLKLMNNGCWSSIIYNSETSFTFLNMIRLLSDLGNPHAIKHYMSGFWFNKTHFYDKENERNS